MFAAVRVGPPEGFKITIGAISDIGLALKRARGASDRSMQIDHMILVLYWFG
jgi:hypothetical protein